jgi:tRNA A37 threonylcarbamoyltransferase TsaD
MLVLAHIYEVDECGTLDNIAAQVPFVGVKTVFGHLALARNILSSCLWLAVTLRGGNCAFAGMRNRMQDFVKNSL